MVEESHRIYTVTSECGKYAWITVSDKFEKQRLGANAKTFCRLMRIYKRLFIFQTVKWTMRYHKARGISKVEHRDNIRAQLIEQGYIVIR